MLNLYKNKSSLNEVKYKYLLVNLKILKVKKT